MSVLPVGIGADSAAAGGYQIERSLRFNSADSAYLNRTPGNAPTNADIGTWSFWVKRTKLGVEEYIFGARNGSTLVYTGIRFNFADALEFTMANGASAIARRITTQVFRDTSSWYHFLVVYNSPAVSDRIRMYVNGSEITSFSTVVNPSQNQDLIRWAANGVPNYIGNEGTTPGNYGDYYLAETYYIDGSALDPTSFGEFNSTTGVWQPKAYEGSYGTNGFYLNFSDNSGVTSTTLGADSSGNGNNWTPNNFSVTAGAGNDSLVDTPTNYGTDTGVGGEVRSNYATLNPLANTGIGTLSNGNLTLVTSTNNKTITATMGIPPSGQWYFEITATDYVTDGGTYIGVVNTPFLTSFPANDTWLGILTYNASYNNGTAGDTNNLSQANATQDGDIYCFAIDATNGKFWMGRSRSGTLVWADGVTPSVNGSGATTLALPSGTLYPMAWRGSSYNETYDFNFGQRAFAHTAPSGFKALCTQNLPEPTIVDGGQYFNTVLWTGDGTSSRSITGVGFQPDWAWIKKRNAAFDHNLFDAVRGAGKGLESSSTAAEFTVSDRLTAFGSDGFTVGNSSAVNNTSDTYVAWNWKANGAGVSNTDGTITSTVSANTDSGFSIVTYTGTGSAATVGHGLGVAPSMVIVKNRNGAYNWGVYFNSFGAAYLDLTDGFDAGGRYTSYFNGTAPTASVFSLGTSVGSNRSGDSHVAYCFAAIPGYSAFGSYTGNGSADGPFVYTGFRPAFILVKSSTSALSWEIRDDARSPYNEAVARLFPNLSNAESSGNAVDLLSNGFKIRAGGPGNWNSSGETYIYACFAETPFSLSLAR